MKIEDGVLVDIDDSDIINGELTIPEGVTVIRNINDRSILSGDYIKKNLKKITFPNSLITIGRKAFNGCYNLMTLRLPIGLTDIGTGAFSGCNNLTTLTLPIGLTDIGPSAFCFCDQLTTLILPSGLKSIGRAAFYGCSRLTLSYDNLKTLTLPSGLTSIGHGAFLGCYYITTLILSSGMISIDSGAFLGCDSLRTVIIIGQLPALPNDFFKTITGLSAIVIIAPTTQWEATINTLPHDYQSLAITIDRECIETIQQLALKALLRAFHLSPVGRAAVTNDNSREIFERHHMKNLWAHVFYYLADDYLLYSKAKAALSTCPLPTNNSQTDFSKYRIRCDAIVNDYIAQGEQQLAQQPNVQQLAPLPNEQQLAQQLNVQQLAPLPNEQQLAQQLNVQQPAPLSNEQQQRLNQPKVQDVIHTKTIKTIHQAITVDYLPWMQRHAKGRRGLTRFSHWYHGDSGVKRAQALLALINNPTCQPETLRRQLANVWAQSSNAEHSLKNYLRRTLSSESYQWLNLPVVETSILVSNVSLC
jgi:hypothetical protein